MHMKNSTFYHELRGNLLGYFGSSLPEVFCKKHFLRNVTEFTGKHLSEPLF